MDNQSEKIYSIIEKLFNDENYMFDYTVEFDQDLVKKIDSVDRDEVFKGMLEEVNTYDIRMSREDISEYINSIFEIASSL